MKYYEVDFHIHIKTLNEPEGCGPDCGMLLQDVRDIIAANAGETGFETFEDTDDGIKGYVRTDMFDAGALAQSMEDLPFGNISVTYDVREAEDKDWNEQWEKEGFEPIIVNGMCIIHDGRHLPEKTDYETSVEIDARFAFGTGTHETTRMMVQALTETELAGKSVLDCGCGTGILGIVALKRGAAMATGYDIDEWSVDNARHNAIINMVGHRYEALLGDASVLDGITRKYDVVTANINRNILLADMPKFRNMMAEKARLLLSGFYIEDIDVLKEKAEEHGLQFERYENDNNWACMALRLA